MAHCINCEKLISDRPDHGDYCSPECEAEYRAGADQERLSAEQIHNQVVNSRQAIATDVNSVYQVVNSTKVTDKSD